MIISLSEAKAQLSKIVDLAYRGEEIVIAKHNTPLVDLVPHKPKGKRKLGRMRGTFSLPDNFLDESHEINEMFYGDDA
ncbi:MAG: type II toxin-antitoxin system prevent-host-death family antitoxin [Verrucomicrobia bacterium]|nr:type II toxin-antitoxin system prevent-host-death family antitoxin [Verrucomicrobiota bacterium]MCC5850780.1 type II toxin-antitoxin system prevent-host-death family antitoxin [Verrucomicrobiota bacterium]MCH8528932.1 type II toxin-antitoxin system prevent-host-death family antitoxin [Kiritimatiellia bacterium]